MNITIRIREFNTATKRWETNYVVGKYNSWQAAWAIIKGEWQIDALGPRLYAEMGERTATTTDYHQDREAFLAEIDEHLAIYKEYEAIAKARCRAWSYDNKDKRTGFWYLDINGALEKAYHEGFEAGRTFYINEITYKG